MEADIKLIIAQIRKLKVMIRNVDNHYPDEFPLDADAINGELEDLMASLLNVMGED